MKKLKFDLMCQARYGGKGLFKVLARDYFYEVVLVGVVVLVVIGLILVNVWLLSGRDSEKERESELKKQMVEPDGTRIVGELTGVRGIMVEKERVLGVVDEELGDFEERWGEARDYVLELGGFEEN